MKFAFRFILTMIFLAVSSLPEFISSDFSGVRQIEVTHSHAESDHHHDHNDADHDHHHHDEQASNHSTEAQVDSTQHAADTAHSHTHQIVLVGIQALVSNPNYVLVSIYQIVKFPFPKDLLIPSSQDLGSIFRPPISA